MTEHDRQQQENERINPPHEHCWHADRAQPMVLIHNGTMTAYTCCHCGERKTVTAIRPDATPHGPYLAR